MEYIGSFANRTVEIPQLMRSEACSQMLQAFTRSNLRNHAGEVCGECDIYLIDSERDLSAMLSSTFPGCEIKSWDRITTKLTATQKAILDHLGELGKFELSKGVKRSAVYKALKIEKSHFAKVTKDKQFVVEAARMSFVVGKTRIRYEDET